MRLHDFFPFPPSGQHWCVWANDHWSNCQCTQLAVVFPRERIHNCAVVLLPTAGGPLEPLSATPCRGLQRSVTAARIGDLGKSVNSARYHPTPGRCTPTGSAPVVLVASQAAQPLLRRCKISTDVSILSRSPSIPQPHHSHAHEPQTLPLSPSLL